MKAHYFSDHHMHPGNAHFFESFAYLIASAGASLVAIVQSRFDPDIVSVLGAMLASVLAVMEARKKDRALGQTASVFLASAGFGSVLPGSIMWTVWPDKVPMLSWHVWALMGIIAGLLGWSLAAWVISLRSRLISFLDRRTNRYLRDDAPPPPTPPTL